MKTRKALMKPLRKQIAAILIINLLSATTTRAEVKTCDQVLKMCDQALEDERKESEALKKLDHSKQRVIEAQNSHIEVQREAIDDLKASNESILNDPKVWAVIGFGLGVWVMKK